jgi:hypothetical protein
MGIKIGDEDKFGYGFYDLNAKVTHVLSDKDKLSLSFYSGKDILGVYTVNRFQFQSPLRKTTQTSDTDIVWGNDNIAVGWTHVLSSRMFCTTVLGMSHYRMNTDAFSESTQINVDAKSKEIQESDVDYHSGIYDLDLSTAVEYSVSSNQMVRFGL